MLFNLDSGAVHEPLAGGTIIKTHRKIKRLTGQEFNQLPTRTIGFRIRKMTGLGRIYRRIFHRGEVDCAETRRLGSDYLENGLPPRKRSLVQAHLDKCGPCRAFVETLAATIAMLNRVPRATPPPSFKESVLERVRKDQQGR